MDEADKGNEQAEQDLSARIQAVRSRAHNKREVTGECLNCGQFAGAHLFCDLECRTDYEKREAVHRRIGARPRD